MARYRHYDLQQTKMIAVCCGRQLLPGAFEYALSLSFWPLVDRRGSTRLSRSRTAALGQPIFPEMTVTLPAAKVCRWLHRRLRVEPVRTL